MSTQKKITIDDTPIKDFSVDWGNPDGTGKTAKSLGSVQDFLKDSIRQADRLITLTCSEFAERRRNGALIPGKQYLIDDYRTFYYEGQHPDMCEVNSLIPVIVTANGIRSIDPRARLADGSAEIMIEIYDAPRYAFNEYGLCCVINGKDFSDTFQDYEDPINGVTDDNGVEYFEYEFYNDNGKAYYVYLKYADGYNIIEDYPMYVPLTTYFAGGVEGIRWSEGMSLTAGGTICWADNPDYSNTGLGWGEITWMRDLNGNEAPFDFKSVRWKFNSDYVSTMKNLRTPLTADTPYPTFSDDSRDNAIRVNANGKLGAIVLFNICRGNDITVNDNAPRYIVLENCRENRIVNDGTMTDLYLKHRSHIYNSRIMQTQLAQGLGTDTTMPISQSAVNRMNTSLSDRISPLEDFKNIAIGMLPVTQYAKADITVLDARSQNPENVMFDYNTNTFYAQDADGQYYKQWDAFFNTENNDYCPDNTAYSNGNLFVHGNQRMLYRRNPYSAARTQPPQFFTLMNEPGFLSYDGVDTITITPGVTIINNFGKTIDTTITVSGTVVNQLTPIATYKVIVIVADGNLSWSMTGRQFWENGAPPVIQDGYVYVFDITQTYYYGKTLINQYKTFITYKSIPLNM